MWVLEKGVGCRERALLRAVCQVALQHFPLVNFGPSISMQIHTVLLAVSLDFIFRHPEKLKALFTIGHYATCR